MKRLLVGIAVLGVAACSTKKPGDTTTPGDATTLEAPAARGPSDDLKALLASVPPDAGALLFIDAPLGDWGVEALMPPERAKAMRAELEAYMRRELGIDVLDARALVVFAGLGQAGPTGGLLLRPVSGALKSNELADGELQASLLGDTLVIGPAGATGTAQRVAQTRESGESVVGAIEWLGPWLDAGPHTIGLAVDLASLAAVPGMPPGFERATLSVGGGTVELDVHGDQAVLEGLRRELVAGMEKGVAEVETKKAAATAPGGEPIEGIAAIIAYHVTAGAIERVPPVVDGAVTLEIPLVGEASGVGMTAIIGVLSAVAIPAFMKYIAKSKTTEAKSRLGAMRAGARAYAVENGRFPPSAPLSPAGGPCGVDKCQPDAARWQHPTWQALNFSVDEPHYYAYEFVSDGQTFTARALGDLDGDGQHSTFEVYGTMEDGIPAGAGTVAAENELE